MNIPGDGYAAIGGSPVGNIGIRLKGDSLSQVDILHPAHPLTRPASALAADMLDQILHYFEDARWQFGMPVNTSGTGFQHRVWAALREIPPGGVLSYGVLARKLGTGARAVGAACRANPVPLVVPCHRVVAAGDLGGFMGEREGRALAIKRWLLDHERRAIPPGVPRSG